MQNPALAKILSKIAIDVAVDEKKRKTALMIILAPTIFLLIHIAFVLYIFTSPLSMIVDFFMPNELKEVQDMQYDYGYNQTLGVKRNTITDRIMRVLLPLPKVYRSRK